VQKGYREALRMSPRIPIAIFASGRGTGFDAIRAAVAGGGLPARITALVCDKPGAPVLEKAEAAGIPALLLPPPERRPGEPEEARRGRHEEAILEALDRTGMPRFLVFAGYMRVITGRLIEASRSERG